MSVLVKVCGLTRAEDAVFAAAQGADLLGFVRHLPSPRHCPDLRIAAPFLDRAVLVQVSHEPQAILETARQHGFSWVQPYLPAAVREAGALLLREAGLSVILPWPDSPGQAALPADLYLWEPSPEATGVVGGSGQGHAMAFPPPGPFLVAGGLDGDNLVARLSLVPPSAAANLRGFDAASRLERAPGCKDPQKVVAFIRIARSIAPLEKEPYE
ncbi:MAG TPA: phosphoribosylanthranilate isomerase [Geothrix sp.]|nr:phosphoribosylanthranilate isomerase [Geothrix sp.]